MIKTWTRKSLNLKCLVLNGYRIKFQSVGCGFLLQGTPIQYGYGGKAKHQLLSLAIKSYIAMQTVNYDCKGTKSATSAIGWDGTDLPVMETTKSVMKDISVDLQCEVSVTLEN